MAEVGRDPWSSSAPNLLLSWGHLEPAVWDYVQTAFEYLQGRNSTTSWDNLCQYLGILTAIKGFLDVQIDNSFLTALMTTLFICFNVFSQLKRDIWFPFLNRRFTEKKYFKIKASEQFKNCYIQAVRFKPLIASSLQKQKVILPVTFSFCVWTSPRTWTSPLLLFLQILALSGQPVGPSCTLWQRFT